VFRRTEQGCWLPTPFASFPFTSPPVRHRVPSGSERAIHKTVTTASGTGHIYCAATSLQRSLATFDGGSCKVPEAVVTVLCTPDDGCG